jgi:hypothetical protein
MTKLIQLGIGISSASLAWIAAVALGGCGAQVGAVNEAIIPGGCYTNPNADNCNGVDPQASGCAADAITVPASNPEVTPIGTLGTVELRWSARCQTNWSRVYNFESADGIIPYFGNHTGGGGVHTKVPAQSYTWSTMIFAPDFSVSACGEIMANTRDVSNCGNEY